jgi:hypothetical protein
MASKARKPGDVLLDRYLRGADEPTREGARDRWKALIRAFLKVTTRLTLEEDDQTGDSPKADRRPTIQSLP